MPKYFTYLLLFETGYLYTGCTGNFARRERNHWIKRGKFKLIWKEINQSREAALMREKQIKSWGRDKKLALAANDTGFLKFSAKRSNVKKAPISPKQMAPIAPAPRGRLTN